MALQHHPSTTTCPYCAQPVSAFGGRAECPHCAHLIFSVPCPKCARPTLNLTLIPRYGKATCFSCQSVYEHLPETPPAIVPQRVIVAEVAPPAEPVAPPIVTPRAPKNPTMPTVAEARAVTEQCLIGLERAAQDREILCAPDLRAVITRYLDTVQAALALDTAMENGEISAEWLAVPAHLDTVIHLCFTPLWPDEALLLPPTVQAWALAVDDAVRRWQYARRRWLADACGLEMMPTVPAMTTVNPVWHEVIGTAPIVSEVLAPGFLLRGEVARRARVLAEA